MSSVYPNNLDSFPTVSGGASLSGHADLHNDLKDAVEALEDKVGVDGSTNTSSIDYKLANLGDTYYTETEVDNALAGKLDSSNYTANDVLDKIKTVDGATSGLDADLLDGNHASAFLTSGGTAVNSQLLDNLDSSQFLRSDADDTTTGRLTSRKGGLGSNWSTCQIIVDPGSDAGIAIRTGNLNKYTVQLRAGGDAGSSVERLYITGYEGGGAGTRYANVSCGTVTESSALRFKKDVQPVFVPTGTDAIDLVKQINTSSYIWKNDTTNTRVVGVIADDLVDVFPEAVQYGQEGLVEGIETQRMVYATLGALRQAINKIETLEAKVAELEAR